MADATGIRAGGLYWEVDVKQATNVQARVAAIGKELDKALTKGRAPNPTLTNLARDASTASERVRRVTEQFARLKSQFDLGQIDARKYASRLADLSRGIQRTGNLAGLSTRELKTLSGTFNAVSRAQQSLGTGTQTVNQKVQALVNRVRVLRNEWQKTGSATDETKLELRDLMRQMDKLGNELREGENGWKRYNAQIARLSVSGRNAEATIAGMEGRMSRLGLASQVNLALTNQLTSSLYRFGPAGAIAGQSLGVVAGGAGALSTGMLVAGGAVVGVGVAAASLVRTGIPELKEFQSALRVLVATGEDFTEERLDQALRDAAEAAGSAGKQFRRAEIATALAEIVKAGVDANDAIRLLAPGMQLAAVTGQDLNTSTSNLLANLRQFGLDTEDAQRAADALATADLAAAHGAAELSAGLATVGPVANAAGISLEDTLGILVELDNKGLDPADKGATALRGTMSALLDPTAEARTVLDRLGVALKNADGTSRPLLTVLQELQRALKGNGEAAQDAAKIFDTRAITAILNMSDASSELAESLKDSQGAAERYADTVLDKNLADAQDRLATSFHNLALSTVSTFGDDIIAVTDALAGFLSQVDELMNAHSFLEFLAILDPNYRGFASMTLGQQIRTIIGIPGTIPGPQEAPTAATATPAGGSGAGASGGRPSGPPIAQSLDQLIAKARQLKADMDAAVTPAAWLHASDAVKAFQASSVDAARAWEAVAATSTSVTKTARDDARTVQGIFDDLAAAEKQAQVAADAQGNTAAANIDSLQARIKAASSALNELLARPDANTQENKDKVSYLLARITELQAELKAAQAAVDALSAAEAARVKAAQEARDRIVQSQRSATRQGLIESAERDRIEALTATPQEVAAAEEAAERIGASMAEATERGRQAAQDRLTRTRKARGLGAQTGVFIQDTNDVFNDEQIASIESAVRIINSLDEATQRGAIAADARVAAEQRLRGELDKRERTAAKLLRLEEAQNALDAARIARETEARLATVRGAAAGTRGAASLGAILTPENQAAVEAGIRTINSLNDATARGVEAVKRREAAELKLTQAYEARDRILGSLGETTRKNEAQASDIEGTIARLQQRILNLTRKGYDPASEAVQNLARQVNELNLQLALQELRAEGAGNISDFARSVLEANGVIAKTTETASTLLERLEALGGTTGGLARFVTGLKQATVEGASTEDIIGGVTAAVNGLNEALQGTGNTVDLIRSVGSGIAEIVGTAAGIPGLGQLFGAVFDLGETIVNGISDAFTGDSPAARAIREGLTPALTTAISQGIVNGIRGADGWQDDLKDSLKVVFLQSLIQAFVNGAIIQTILQPVIDKYSKLIAAGNIEAATAFLRTALPGALNQATAAAEGFVSSIPSGFLAPSPTAGAQPSTSQQASTFRLPDALPIGASSAVANFGGYVRSFGTAVGSFGDWVSSLQQQGIRVTVDSGHGGGGGSALAARTA